MAGNAKIEFCCCEIGVADKSIIKKSSLLMHAAGKNTAN